MVTSINHNLLAINTNRVFNINYRDKTKNTEKLSSGYRINRAADDAAGLAISEKMRRQVRGLNRAAENISTGISYCQVADGALNEIHDMLHRMTTLSLQSSNGTNTDTDREYLNQELQQLKTECGRIFQETSFNERLIWDSPNAKEVIGYESKRAVNNNSNSSGFDVTNENYRVVPYSSLNVKATEADGISLSWMDHDGKTHTTEPISWDELKEKNYRFDISDYYGGPDGPNADLYDSAGNPYYNYRVSFNPREEATIADIVKAVNGCSISTHRNTGNSTQWAGGTAPSSSVTINYPAEYASRKQSGGFDFDASDDDYIEPVKNTAGSNLSTHPSYDSVEQAKTDSTGWTFDFTMMGIGDVKAKCSSVSFSASDYSPEAEGTWWHYVTYGNGQKYQSTITHSAAGNMQGLMSTLTGTNGLLSLANGGSNRSSGSLTMNFDLISDNSFSYGNTSGKNVGSLWINFSVDQSDTEETILNKVKSALNDNTLLDIAKTGTNAESVTMYPLYTNSNNINVPVYGGVTKIQIQSGVEAGQFIDIIYDCLGLPQLGIKDTDISTVESAQDAVDEIKGAMQIVSEQRSLFGAYQNRLEHAYRINMNSSENTQAGESLIRDTDMNSAMVEHSKHDILEQAGAAMLTQANQSRQALLQLLG